MFDIHSVQFLDHAYYSVREPRIWLQGGRFEKAGFEKGVRYRIQYDVDNAVIELIADEAGSHVVSGKRKPNSDNFAAIIDIRNETVEHLTENVDRIRVDVAVGYIRISQHHLDLRQQQREDTFIEHMREGVLTEGVLCAGIGMASAAIHEGLERNGYSASLSWAVDRDRRYLDVADLNNPVVTTNTLIIHSTLEELEPELLSQVDILQFSLSCTSHSRSGKSKNQIAIAEEHDTDATGIFGLMRVVEKTNPGLLISENVTEARDSATYCLLRSMLTLLGYRIAEVVLDHHQSGSFERRKRYWFVAVSKGLPLPSVELFPTYSRRYTTLQEILEPIPDSDPSWSNNDYLKAKAIRDKAAGKGFANRFLATPTTDHVKTIGRGYAKKRSTEVMLVREDGMERLLTPKEHARCKSAPESLIARVSATVAHEGLGQGIDWMQGVGIGEWIAQGVLAPLATGLAAAEDPAASSIVMNRKNYEQQVFRF